MGYWSCWRRWSAVRTDMQSQNKLKGSHCKLVPNTVHGYNFLKLVNDMNWHIFLNCLVSINLNVGFSKNVEQRNIYLGTINNLIDFLDCKWTTPGKNLKMTPKVTLSGIGLGIIKNSCKDFFQNSTHSFLVGKFSHWRIKKLL